MMHTTSPWWREATDDCDVEDQDHILQSRIASKSQIRCVDVVISHLNTIGGPRATLRPWPAGGMYLRVLDILA